ncbi:hypothetical protein LAZ67_12000846 [Cordylochernes scorpioides]|uniref:CCHC-type domain-containing protein n=1 Tax=Cordylochernes scorpioides TaxID=51811 RepID=A0ABY6L0Y7_9ARAC|nr:hypothetical protein LAZ67_12000846 [Cordylochernes scorpioides]
MGEELKEIKEKIEKLYDELFSLDEVDIDKESEAYDGSMNKIGSLRVKIENERKLKDKLADIKPNGSQANIKLPQFDLPIYDGDMGNWINFKELFLTTIDAHPGLTNIQKLQYLNSAVKGEAARLIRGFPLLSENYGQAWSTLLSRYDNPRELAYAQVSKIFSLRAIKNPSAKCLHEFMDVCNEAIRNLETLELKRNQFVDVILVHFLQQKLSENLRLDWELSVDNTLPSYDKFIAFISRHARSMSCAVKECSKREETTGSRFPKCQSYGMLIEKSDTCILCKSKHHPLYMCNLFCKMPLKEKLNVVKGHKLCFNCLRKGHFSWNCRLNQRCKVCKGKHHTMIHYDKPSTEGASAQVENTTPKEHESAINLTNTQQANCNDSHVLLATARIKIKNGLGKLCTCRALLDSGSQVTMITKGCCERLGLVQRKSDRMIIGVGNTPVQHSSSTVSVTFCPLNNSEEFSVEAVVTGVLTSEIPNFRLKDPNWPTLKNLKLADPEFYIQAPIDMILGADIYTELMLNGSISLGEGLPMAINTRLGWVLLGKLMGTSESNTEVCNLSLQSEPELEFVLKRFWETESVPSPDLCTQDEDCERLFSNNHGRDSHGRYWVKLPFRQHRPLLGESREKALRRFLSLEGKLCKNVKLYDQYRGFMKEYEHLNHMERVPIAEVKRELCRCYYMPHHPVIREQSTTTKMRVVFDASAKSENNVSLNQFLHKGQKIQQDVFFILLRFRTYPVAITADIEKMYRQIRIHPEDADYQRILWRPSPEEPVVDYRLLTVTYGTTSAPFLAMRTLQQLAEDEGQNYPGASRVTLNDFYVDDLLTGAQTIAEAKELIDQLKDLMKKGGFHLRKWNSNCHEIVSHVEEMNEEKKINLEKGAISKILGIVWDHVQDTFRVNITLPEEVVTKRDLLSNIARIFDPLGFLSPTTVALKIIMQELWRGGTGWDEHIPNDIKEKWNNFRAELLKLGDLSIPRYVWACEKDQDVQLHGFCDASSVAYSAVCYLRTVSLDGQVHISMLAAKTRVAPCKSLTLPRLELCAALLLSQLYRSVVDSLKIDIGRAYLWSDSQISLSWIKSDPNRWRTFIHNRVVKIQQLSDRNSWRHVSGKDNPADCASRGIMPAALSGHTLWWQGPTWSKDNNFVQNQDNCYGRECYEEEKVALACQSRVSVCPEVVTKYSTFIKTRRIIAWCLRFITNCRVSLKKREIGTLSKKELENAVIRIIGWIQKDEFGEEMQDLRNTGHASRKSRILQLNPFIDASGMLRVGALFLIAPSHILTLRRFNLRRVFLERNSDAKRVHAIRACNQASAGRIVLLALPTCKVLRGTYETIPALDGATCGLFRRNSSDKMISPNATHFVEFLDNNLLTILNGRSMADQNGNFTYISDRGSSVLDYFVVTPLLLDLIENFQVECSPYSDHLPITLSALIVPGSDRRITSLQSMVNYSRHTNPTPLTSYRWTHDNSQFFSQALNEIHLNWNHSIDSTMRLLTDKIIDTMGKAGMQRRSKTLNPNSKPWFDRECYLTKKNTKSHLKIYMKSKKETDRVNYISKKKFYAALIRDKKKKYYQSLHVNLSSNTHDSKNFWKTIIIYKKKKFHSRKHIASRMAPILRQTTLIRNINGIYPSYTKHAFSGYRLIGGNYNEGDNRRNLAFKEL